MVVAKERIKAIIRLDEGDATKVHEAVALPVFGSSDSGHISGLILEPTKQQKGQYRRLGSFRLYKSKYCKAFEAASAERSCWVESHELLRFEQINLGRFIASSTLYNRLSQGPCITIR